MSSRRGQHHTASADGESHKSAILWNERSAHQSSISVSELDPYGSAGGSCLPESKDGHLEARPTESTMGDSVGPVVDSSRLGALDSGEEGSLGCREAHLLNLGSCLR